MPTNRPYLKPLDGLLIFKMLVLYRNTPDTIPIEIPTVIWMVIPAIIADDIGEWTPTICPNTIQVRSYARDIPSGEKKVKAIKTINQSGQ